MSELSLPTLTNPLPHGKAAFTQIREILDPDRLVPYPGAIPERWQAIASRKGYHIAGRIRDRYHLALRCTVCGHLQATRIYTLTSAQPQCPNCMTARLEADAEAAGVMHLHRDPDHRHYSHYRAPCGHQLRRQHEIVRRAAAGRTGLRCETCHARAEAAEAEARGWQLIGPDPEGDPSYRLYAHARGCRAVQRIARVNMQTGRFGCHRCGEGWCAAPSALYAMAFTLASGRELVKFGYSRDPESRLLHQLRIDPEMPCELLCTVPMASGQAALRIEKRLHARLRRCYPEAVIDPQHYRHAIRVRSEIYDASLTPVILELLNRIERPRHA